MLALWEIISYDSRLNPIAVLRPDCMVIHWDNIGGDSLQYDEQHSAALILEGLSDG